MRNPGRALRAGFTLLVACSSACSSATRLAAGPVSRTVRHEPQRFGAEALGRAVLGDSNGTSFLGTEAAARVLATSREQLLGAGLGAAWFGSFGRGLVTLDGTPMLAFEHVPGSLLTVGTLRGGVGLGYALEKSTAQYATPWPDPSFSHVVTRSTALTLELGGAIDAPITRGPEYSVSVLLGIAWLEQHSTVYSPPGWPLPFRTRGLPHVIQPVP
jgi:hypothetical protein